jgi:hypothetical protein
LLRQDGLAVALLVVVAAPVGAVPGTTHAVWQLAALVLQVIMQLVTVEVCASRIDLWLAAEAAFAANRPLASTAERIRSPGTLISSDLAVNLARG